jgi:tetrahydromethanopterin S-methyltransferase subunit A
VPGGSPSQFVFRGKSAIDLYRSIVRENLISKFDHAAYIGKELARAEAALKEGRPYVQDRA